MPDKEPRQKIILDQEDVAEGGVVDDLATEEQGLLTEFGPEPDITPTEGVVYEVDDF